MKNQKDNAVLVEIDYHDISPEALWLESFFVKNYSRLLAINSTTVKEILDELAIFLKKRYELIVEFENYQMITVSRKNFVLPDLKPVSLTINYIDKRDKLCSITLQQQAVK